jgi:hypothetical protein
VVCALCRLVGGSRRPLTARGRYDFLSAALQPQRRRARERPPWPSLRQLPRPLPSVGTESPAVPQTSSGSAGSRTGTHCESTANRAFRIVTAPDEVEGRAIVQRRAPANSVTNHFLDWEPGVLAGRERDDARRFEQERLRSGWRPRAHARAAEDDREQHEAYFPRHSRCPHGSIRQACSRHPGTKGGISRRRLRRMRHPPGTSRSGSRDQMEN